MWFLAACVAGFMCWCFGVLVATSFDKEPTIPTGGAFLFSFVSFALLIYSVWQVAND